MKNYITLLILIISFSACSKHDNRKVIDDVKTISEVKKGTNTVDIADLPIHMDSTNYLIHPIGNYKVRNSRSEYLSGDGYSSGNYSVSNYNGYKIAGDLSNVKFQHINSDELKPLTNAIIRINAMSFLIETFYHSKKEYYVYDVIDKDTNADKKLGHNDLKSIYISNGDGSKFKKLSPDFQDVTGWKTITIANRLYFKTIEDTDSNGEFDNKDQTHYFYVDLNQDNSKVVEYYPI